MDRVLAIFAHPDDEASCVGTLANHSDAGDAVKILWLSRGERTSVLRMTAEEKKRERLRQADAIGRLLGVETEFLDLPDAGIENTRENALRVADELRRWKPTVIVTWNRSEVVGPGHPDHRNTHSIVIDAVSYARYQFSEDQEVHREHLSLYLTYDKSSKHPVRFIDVSAQEERIREFFRIYKGMYGEWPVEDFIFANLVSNGMFSSSRLAEAFNFIQQRRGDRLLI